MITIVVTLASWMLLLHQCEAVSVQARAWCAHTHSHPEPSILFYNRIPKCGSTTMKSIFVTMLHHYHFTYIDLQREYWGTYNNNLEKQQALFEHIRENHKDPNKKLAIVGHVEYFPNIESGLTSEYSPTIEFTNLVRECTARVESNVAYAIHSSVYAREMKKANKTYAFESQLLNSTRPKKCLVTKDCLVNSPAMKSPTNLNAIGRYFTGVSPLFTAENDALIVNKTMIAMTKGNMRSVGLLEHMYEYLEMLECLYPSYFRNVTQIYQGDKKNDGLPSVGNITATELVELNLLHEAAADVCKGSTDEILYKNIETMFWERYHAMKANPNHCCRRIDTHVGSHVSM